MGFLILELLENGLELKDLILDSCSDFGLHLL
jgi:hypothetical protein